MKKPRLYFDTSVFGGIYDIEFQTETDRIRGYNSINLKNGYMQLDIRSPKDIITNEN